MHAASHKVSGLGRAEASFFIQVLSVPSLLSPAFPSCPPTSESVQCRLGWGSEQPGVLKGVPVKTWVFLKHKKT